MGKENIRLTFQTAAKIWELIITLMDAESGSFTAVMIEHVEGAMELLEAAQVEG